MIYCEAFGSASANWSAIDTAESIVDLRLTDSTLILCLGKPGDESIGKEEDQVLIGQIERVIFCRGP